MQESPTIHTKIILPQPSLQSRIACHRTDRYLQRQTEFTVTMISITAWADRRLMKIRAIAMPLSHRASEQELVRSPPRGHYTAQTRIVIDHYVSQTLGGALL